MYLEKDECEAFLRELLTEEEMRDYVASWHPVGSAWTLGKDKAADFDVLVLCDRSGLTGLLTSKYGLPYDGKEKYGPAEGEFISFRKDKWNLLLTSDDEFYARFYKSMNLCRALKLESRDDRILVVAAVRDDEFPLF